MSSAAAQALSALARTRGGGGIAKRRPQGRPERHDREGDLQMGGQVPTGPKGGRPGRGPRGADHGPRKPMSGSGGGSGGVASRTRSRAPGSYTKGSAAIAGMVEMKVTGWKESKSNAQECIVFLERKTGVRFKKTRVVGDELLVQIPMIRAPAFLEWDNAQFASSHLRIQPTADLPPAIHVNGQPTEQSAGAVEAANILTNVLTSRYDAESKMLNLGNLMADPILQQSGFFGQASTHTKVFPAMMKVADQQFASNAEKREKVVSVTLEQNSLTDLQLVTSLAQTFPELKNLSLSYNNFATWKDLDSWRWKFRKLEQLMLVGNPITQLPGYREEARRRYPTLLMLDAKVYPDPPVTAGAKKGAQEAGGQMVPLPVPIKQHGYVHDYSVAGSFLQSFFPAFDNDREALLRQYYDENSTFSLSVNTSAPRNPNANVKVQKWDHYIEKSRNLTRLSHYRAISNRLQVGPNAISKVWKQLPATKHDTKDASKWTFSSWNVPMGNVQATWIAVNGEYVEPEATGDRASVRSFDRTFVLVPGPQGLRVLNDIFVLRAWGGSAAWIPLEANALPPQPNPQGNQPGQPAQQQQQPTPAAPVPPQPQQRPPPMGMPAAPVNPVQQQPPAAPPAQPEQMNDQMKAHMLAELRRKSGLTEEFALMCLNETGWVFERAWEAFQTVKNSGNLPANAMAPQ